MMKLKKLLNILFGLLPQKNVISIASLTTANVFNNLVAFVVNIIVAKKLGIEGFGIFSLAFSISMFTEVVGDFGVNLTMIRLFNKYEGKPKKQILSIGTALCIKGILFALIIMISLPLSRFLTYILNLSPVNARLFTVSFVTGGGLFFWTYFQAYLQAYHLFKTLTKYILLYGGLRLIYLPIAYKLFPQNPLSWFIASYTAPIFTLILFGIMPKTIKVIFITFKTPTGIIIMFKKILNYSKWVAVSNIAYRIMPYLARFILAASASVKDVGIFSAGLTFTVAFSTINNAIRMVIFPQATALKGEDQIKNYLNKLVHITPYYIIFTVVGIFSLGCLQFFLLGEEYRLALPVFFVTSGSLAIVVFLGLGTMLIHTMMQPHVEALTNMAKLVLMILLFLILVPLFHALGAAIAYALPLLVGEVWIFRYVNKANTLK